MASASAPQLTSSQVLVGPFQCKFVECRGVTLLPVLPDSPCLEVRVESCDWAPVECGLNEIVTHLTVGVVVSSSFGDLTSVIILLDIYEK